MCEVFHCIRIFLDDVIKWKHIFRVTDPLYGQFTGHRWIPLTKASDAERWCFLWSAPWINSWVHNREAGDLRRSLWRHYNVTVQGCSVVVYVTSLISIEKSLSMKISISKRMLCLAFYIYGCLSSDCVKMLSCKICWVLLQLGLECPGEFRDKRPLLLCLWIYNIKYYTMFQRRTQLLPRHPVSIRNAVNKITLFTNSLPEYNVTLHETSITEVWQRHND